MKAVLVGNYGVGNFGDEALREYFLRAFPEVEWVVLSARPMVGELPRLPIGIRSFFGTRWWKTVGAIKRADAVVFGGGTLFTDIESVKACVLWGVHAFVARFFRVPVHLAFQGIGPFKTSVGEGITKRVVRHTATLSVRDEASAARIASWAKNTEVIQTFDPVFALFVEKKLEHRAQNVYVLIPRHTSGQLFDAALDSHSENLRHVQIEIALFQPDDAGERRAVETLRRRYPQANVRTIRTADDLMVLLSRASHCITQRFHGALAAIAAGVPISIVAQASGDKLDQARALEAPGAVDTARALAQKGEDTLREALRD